MELPSDPLYSKVHALAVGVLEGTLVPEERLELEKLILENPAARRTYLEYVQESACLRWLCVEEFPNLVELSSKSRGRQGYGTSRRRIARFVFGGGLACALVAFASNWWHSGKEVSSEPRQPAGPAVAVADEVKAPTGTELPSVTSGKANPIVQPAVATITGLGGVRWRAGSDARQILSRCAIGDRLQLREGSAVLTFDAGAQVTVFGPADFEITSATSIRCRRGRVTTLVDHRGKGFSIETPQAKVVDLGTQFGLQISEKGETEVVVFQGSIDLSYAPRADAGDASGRRMQQGDALRLRNSGEIERLVSVQRNSFMSAAKVAGLRPMEPVIGD